MAAPRHERKRAASQSEGMPEKHRKMEDPPENSGSAYNLYRDRVGSHSIQSTFRKPEDESAGLKPGEQIMDLEKWEYVPTKLKFKNPANLVSLDLNTVLVPAPTFHELMTIPLTSTGKPVGLFYGNTESTYKKMITPFAVDTKYVYSETLKNLASLPKDMIKYLHHPDLGKETEKICCSSDGMHIQESLDYGIKTRAVMCCSLQTETNEWRSYIAIPFSQHKRETGEKLTLLDVLEHLRKVRLHQRRQYPEWEEEPYQDAAFMDTGSKNNKRVYKQCKEKDFTASWGDAFQGLSREELQKVAAQTYHFDDPCGVKKAPAVYRPFPEMLPGLTLNTRLFGRGPKFFAYGPTSCLNAIVTRFDQYGNVQMLVNIRPDDADGDRGEFQMTAGTIARSKEILEKFGMHPKLYEHIEGDFVPMSPRLTTGENIDKRTGRLLGEAKASAQAGIFQKSYAGWNWKECAVIDPATGGLMKREKLMEKNSHRHNESKARQKELGEATFKCLQKWNFYKLQAGIVDDTSTTNEAWVETAYVIHHIQGDSSVDGDLAKLWQYGSPQPGMPNVGQAVWKSIDSSSTMQNGTPKTKYGYMQYMPKPTPYDGEGNIDDFTMKVNNLEYEEPYNPCYEFELWHGDHAIVAEAVANFVKSKFQYKGKAAGCPTNELNWFGKSVAKNPEEIKMVE